MVLLAVTVEKGVGREVALAIANMDGENLTILENGHYELSSSDGLEQDYYKSNPVYVGISDVPKNYTPGYYLVYAVARQKNCTGWEKIKGYDVEAGTSYELYANIEIKSNGVVPNSYDPVGDSEISSNVVVEYAGGSILYQGDVIRQGSKLKWSLYNWSASVIDVIAVYSINGATNTNSGISWGNHSNCLQENLLLIFRQ